MTFLKYFLVPKCFLETETKSVNFSYVGVHLSKTPGFQLISEDLVTASFVEKQIKKVFHPRFNQKLISFIISKLL